MATTDEMHDGGAWAWPCPYCRASNSIDAAQCATCGAQLRDPDEDDLFTTVATDNAQIVDPTMPRVKESLWSTEVPPPETVAAAEPVPPPPDTRPAASGPFSAASSGFQGASRAKDEARSFGADRPPPVEPPPAHSPFRVADQPAAGSPMAGGGGTGPPEQPQAHTPWPAAPHPQAGDAHAGSVTPPAARATPDPHGLSVAVESLHPEERDRCAVPIAVCGALLGDQEVVFGLVAGHLLGHPAVLVLTSSRVLVANARRWKPLVDQFLPGSDLTVHLRHDRDIASITLVQGERLTGVDDISDVAAALDLAERIRAFSV